MADYLVDILPSQMQYHASKDSTLLDAALMNRVFLEHSCKKGQCGICIADILSGSVKNEHGEIVSAGRVLTCCSYAQSDVSLNANYYPQLAEIECKTVPCKIAYRAIVAEDILILKLRLPPTARLDYLPGQYIDLLHQGVRRSYSIACAPTSEGIELHIRLLSNGALSQLLSVLEINQLMRLEGPKGTFFVRKAENPLIFLAGGTGFAPVKAMVEALLNDSDTRDIYIYWGMSSSSRLYTDIATTWALEHPRLRYIPVISEDEPSWSGRKGMVHEAVLEDFSDLGLYHVYACGSPLMLDRAEEALIQQGLLKEYFYKDAFVSSN